MAVFNDLIAGLEKTLNIKVAQDIVENGVGLSLEDGSVVNIEQFPEGEAVHLHCDLGNIPVDVRPMMLMSLMAAHTCGIITQGCYFGFEPQRESLLLFRSLPMRGLPAEIFVEITGHFVEQVQHWRAALPGLYEDTRQQLAGSASPQDESQDANGRNMIKI